MSRFTSLFGLGLLLALSSQPVQADEPAGQRGKREIPPQLLEKFDKDGDGQLDETERAALRKAMEERRAEGKGPGGKGGVSPERRAELIKKFDTNNDGKLDETERAAARKQFGQGGPGGKGVGQRGMNPERRAEFLKKFDANNDGKLDETERAAIKKAFAGRRGAGGRGKGRPGQGKGRPPLKKPGQN